MRRVSRQHSKKGPGRYHGQGMMIAYELKPGVTSRAVKQPQRRYPIARTGGFWKGMPYKTQPEIDRETRERLEAAR